MFTRNLLVVSFVAALSSAVIAQTTVYVDENATSIPHDGSGWCNAFLTLDEALAVSTSGFVVKVADGTYVPDTSSVGDPRDATFTLVSGVAIEGGYAGCGAADPDERDYLLYETTLSGETGDPGDVNDNCDHVVTAVDCGSQTLVEGFTIADGDLRRGTSFPYNSGGGVYVLRGSPAIAHCKFRDNYALHGGGISCIESNATIDLCTFESNSAGMGAGICLCGGVSSVSDCTFGTNTAGGGGGIYAFDSTLTLLRCTFSGGDANGNYGGAVYSSGGVLDADESSFTDGSALLAGGAIFFTDGSVGYLDDCTFSGNEALSLGGGAIYGGDSHVINGCTFDDNHVLYGDGGAAVCGGLFADCVFTNNSCTNALAGGGAVYLGSDGSMERCSFRFNVADSYGGAVSPCCDNVLSHCVFEQNSAVWGGAVGAVMPEDVSLHNCVFTNNTADQSGGALYQWSDSVYPSNADVINCSFSGNSATDGGVLAFSGYSEVVVANTIMWGNTATVDSQIYTAAPAVADVSYSCIQYGYPGVGNIATDPQFTDADLRVGGSSPCIEAGDNDAVPVALAVDMDGNPRIAGCFVDMGAYEWQAVVVQPGDVPGDANADCVVDFDDYEEFSGCVDAGAGDPACLTVFDLNGDGSVDLADFAVYQDIAA